MTAQSLRSAMRRGQWTARLGPLEIPGPPDKWPLWKRKRLAVAIRCAVLFLFYGKHSPEIIEIVGKEKGFDQRKVTKSRVLQYVGKGTKFLLENNVFQEVKTK